MHIHARHPPFLFLADLTFLFRSLPTTCTRCFSKFYKWYKNDWNLAKLIHQHDQGKDVEVKTYYLTLEFQPSERVIHCFRSREVGVFQTGFQEPFSENTRKVDGQMQLCCFLYSIKNKDVVFLHILASIKRKNSAIFRANITLPPTFNTEHGGLKNELCASAKYVIFIRCTIWVIKY